MLDISVRMGSRRTVTTRSLAGAIGISSTSAGVHGHHQWPHTQEPRAHLRLQASVTSVLHSARENRFSSRVALGWKELISRHGRQTFTNASDYSDSFYRFESSEYSEYPLSHHLSEDPHFSFLSTRIHSEMPRLPCLSTHKHSEATPISF